MREWRYVPHAAGLGPCSPPDLVGAAVVLSRWCRECAEAPPPDAPVVLRELDAWLRGYWPDFAAALDAGDAAAFAPGGELSMAVESAIAQAADACAQLEGTAWYTDAALHYAFAGMHALRLGYGRMQRVKPQREGVS